jgi:hypothetical protein
MLGHDDDPQWLDATTAPAKIGSIGRRHRHGRFLVLQVLHQHVRPSAAQPIFHIAPVDPLVGDQY